MATLEHFEKVPAQGASGRGVLTAHKPRRNAVQDFIQNALGRLGASESP